MSTEIAGFVPCAAEQIESLTKERDAFRLALETILEVECCGCSVFDKIANAALKGEPPINALGRTPEEQAAFEKLYPNARRT